MDEDDEEFEKQWVADGEAWQAERDAAPATELSADRTIRTLRVMALTAGALFLGVSSLNVLPFAGLAVFVPWLVIVGGLWWYKRAESKERDKELDKMLGRE